MKKVLFQLVHFALIFSLLFSIQACGSRGGSDSSDTTTDTTTGGGTTTPAVTVADISISASPAAIQPGESSQVTVELLNSTGQPINAAKEIVFSLSSPALGTIIPSVTTSNGSTTKPFTANNIEGIVTVTASVDGMSASQDIQISTTISASTLTASANPASITSGGTSVISATVLDGDGKPMPNGTTVNFKVDNTALGTVVSSATTTDGVAKATFSAGTTLPGIATVTATSGVATGTTTIDVTGTTAGGIEFVSATPQIISIKGSGGQETSEIKFLVKDSSGNPIPTSTEVRLDLSGPNGGEYLGDTPDTTSLTVGTVAGGVTTILHSGTNPGTATISATVLDGAGNDTGLATSSGVIAIGGGTPSAGHFSLSILQKNIAGWDIDNLTTTVTALIADRYSNFNVLKGTTVSFYSECGGIDRAVALNELGQGTVTFRTQNPRPLDVDPDNCGPRCAEENLFINDYNSAFGYDIASNPFGRNPRDGLCTIIAVVDGEEEFNDSNGNGIYDSNELDPTKEPEPFVDTYDDINIEMDDDPVNVDPVSAGSPFDELYEDLVVDRNNNGIFDGFNGKWDKTKRIAERIDLLITDDDLILVTDASSISVGNGSSQTIKFALHDLNFNRPVAGSNLSVSLEGAGTLSGDTETTFETTNAVGTDILSVTITDSDPSTDEAKTSTLKFSFTSGGFPDTASIAGFVN